jgi:hypothetical protein
MHAILNIDLNPRAARRLSIMEGYTLNVRLGPLQMTSAVMMQTVAIRHLTAKCPSPQARDRGGGNSVLVLLPGLEDMCQATPVSQNIIEQMNAVRCICHTSKITRLHQPVASFGSTSS